MTERKNVTLKEPYDQMYKDLKARGEFSRSFDSFSGFVQAMVEQYHDNPDAVRAKYHKEQSERHKKLKKNFEDLSEESVQEDVGDLQEAEEEFFQDFIDLIKSKKGSKKWRTGERGYSNYENGWIRKYSKKFNPINESDFRKKLMKYSGEDELQELEILQKVTH